VIGIGQFVFGKTLGGPLYYFGERSFNISTPGIALVTIFGRNFLRVYSTFSHPNSLAGYLGVGILILLHTYSKKEFVRKLLGIMLICLAFLLTFSLSAFIGIGVCLVFLILIRKKKFNKKNVILFPVVILLISLALPFFSKIALQSKINFSQSVNQRLKMSLAAGKFISQKFFAGQGLNTFVINGSKSGYLGYYLWLLQPVHNTVLLIFSEVGILGLLLFFWMAVKSFGRALLLNNKSFILVLAFILTTGLFDHYWFTLQQNMLLFALIFGKIFQEKI
jgi:O-antigen ligase